MRSTTLLTRSIFYFSLLSLGFFLSVPSCALLSAIILANSGCMPLTEFLISCSSSTLSLLSAWPLIFCSLPREPSSATSLSVVDLMWDTLESNELLIRIVSRRRLHSWYSNLMIYIAAKFTPRLISWNSTTLNYGATVAVGWIATSIIRNSKICIGITCTTSLSNSVLNFNALSKTSLLPKSTNDEQTRD